MRKRMTSIRTGDTSHEAARLRRGIMHGWHDTLNPSIVIRALLIGTAMLAAASCKSDKKPTTRPSSMRERQNEALADPFGYKVSEDEDISGGKLHEYKKDSMKKDLDHVFNP
ncbi:MAG: hypothetical protein H0T11_04550 [Chthoniobacterales bacterium]|nr:hypothetical protein [Chthoniobacterales bacterium]